jgi:uncharacterized membrane protein
MELARNLTNKNPSQYLPLIAFLALCVFAGLMPREWLHVFDFVGNAVCHRIPARSFFVDSTQLPMCARDTGMFSGALLGIVWFAFNLRERVGLYPSRRAVPFFLLAFVSWSFDGFNSYYLLATGQTLFYMPRNELRLVTGAFMGVTLSAYVVPLFNQGVWKDATESHSVRDLKDFLPLVAVAIIVVLAVLWRPDFLHGPLALTSALGAGVLFVVVNSMLVLIALRKHATVSNGSQLVTPLIIGTLFAVIEIAAANLLRNWLSTFLASGFAAP